MKQVRPFLLTKMETDPQDLDLDKSRHLTNATKETNGIAYEKIIPYGIRYPRTFDN